MQKVELATEQLLTFWWAYFWPSQLLALAAGGVGGFIVGLMGLPQLSELAGFLVSLGASPFIGIFAMNRALRIQYADFHLDVVRAARLPSGHAVSESSSDDASAQPKPASNDPEASPVYQGLSSESATDWDKPLIGIIVATLVAVALVSFVSFSNDKTAERASARVAALSSQGSQAEREKKGEIPLCDIVGYGPCPDEAGKKPPLVTQAKLRQIKLGMRLKQVEHVIGAPGDVSSQSELAGDDFATYTWSNGYGGSSVNIEFTNGRVSSVDPFEIDE